MTQLLQKREQGTGNREQGTGNREQGTGNREQGTGNREQLLQKREQGTGNRQETKVSGFRATVKKKDVLQRCVAQKNTITPSPTLSRH
ncbi:MAG: hypothetical protein ACK6A9_21780 [Dolichospermum sp.]